MRLLGVVENMSGDVFGTGGGERLAARARRAAARDGPARSRAARVRRRGRAADGDRTGSQSARELRQIADQLLARSRHDRQAADARLALSERPGAGPSARGRTSLRLLR